MMIFQGAAMAARAALAIAGQAEPARPGLAEPEA